MGVWGVVLVVCVCVGVGGVVLCRCVCDLLIFLQVGPVPWLQPYTDVRIHVLGAASTQSLVVVPISFYFFCIRRITGR